MGTDLVLISLMSPGGRDDIQRNNDKRDLLQGRGGACSESHQGVPRISVTELVRQLGRGLEINVARDHGRSLTTHVSGTQERILLKGWWKRSCRGPTGMYALHGGYRNR